MSNHLPPAPTELDGARVQRFASLEGIAHLAKVHASVDGVPEPQPAALAVAVYPGEEDAYVFHCSHGWSVQSAGHYVSIAAAVLAAEWGFPGVSERWVVVTLEP